MKHITYAEKSLLAGNEAADVLMAYAAQLAQNNTADTVELAAYGVDGDEVVATFLLSAGASLMAESTHSKLPEPDNAAVIAYMLGRMSLLSDPPAASPDASPLPFDYDTLS